MDLSQVTRIEAYKTDLFIVDSICFDLHFADGSVVSKCEEDDEWRKLLARVERLPGFDKQWFGKVAFPAFKECRTVIYEAKR